VKPLPNSPDVLAVAQRVIWFEAPEQAVTDPVRFLAYRTSCSRPALKTPKKLV
jgi:hypothetical protein